jgi:enamine deaminase RidA (YjgF/YER057c/UK114 family)
MGLELIDPDDLSKNASYSQVAVAAGSRLIFVAGQVSENADGELVGEGDFAAQARQAFANVGRAVRAAGAEPGQVARLTIYVVDHRPEYLPLISEARVAVFGEHKPTDVILGVQRLAESGRMIEVDAFAVA